MTPRSFLLTPELADYVRASSEAPDDVAADLLAETAAMAERGEAPATFQIAPEQGAFMQLLTRALGVRRAIEIGTFTGFSALCIARGLPDDGSLLCLDRNEEWTTVARRYWERAGLADRIELRLGDALPTLRVAARRSPRSTSRSSTRTRRATPPTWTGCTRGCGRTASCCWTTPCGRGRCSTRDTDENRVLADMNAALAADPRWETVLLPMADGLTMLRKR